MEELHSAIASLQERKEDHVRRRSHLQAQADAAKAVIKQRRDAQTVYQRSLDAQARFNIPELRFWEHCLGLRIEGTQAGDESLRFVFRCVDAKDDDREAWFEMSLNGEGNKVVSTKPRLEKEDVERVEERLNESRDIGGLLKGMRALFVDAFRS